MYPSNQTKPNEKIKKTEENKPSKEQLLQRIKEMDDSLRFRMPKAPEAKNLATYELIDRYLSFYHSYPEDPYSAECLDRVQMIYTGLNIPQRAVQYADTLLLKYPKYTNRALVLENQASTYDMFITPRDTSKVSYYYNLILKEFPTLSIEKRQDIEFRLKHLKLTLPELIEYRMRKLEN